MDVYKDTPVGVVRRAIAEGSLAVKADEGRTVDAIISAADSAKPTLCLALDSTAYDSISHALAHWGPRKLRVKMAILRINLSVTCRGRAAPLGPLARLALRHYSVG